MVVDGILFSREGFTGLFGHRSEAKIKVGVISINTPCSIEAYVYVGVSNVQVNDHLYSYFAKCTDLAEGEKQPEAIECEDTVAKQINAVENEDIAVTPDHQEINEECQLAIVPTPPEVKETW